MRVCHIWHTFFPFHVAGIEHYILHLSNFLSQKDRSMHFLLLTDKTHIPFWRERQIQKSQSYNGLAVHRLGPNIPSYLESVLFKAFHRQYGVFDNLVTKSLYREAAGMREMSMVDIFHVHGLWEPRYPAIGLRLSQHFRRPLVVSLHCDKVGSDIYSMPIANSEMLSALRHASAITTYSREVLNNLRELGLDHKTYLIPNFIDTKAFERPTSSGKNSGTRVILTSRLDEAKDPITPVRAFSYVTKEVPEATLQIVGYGPLYQHIRDLVEDLNLEQAVNLLGKQTNVKKFLWNSDIFITTKGSYLATLEAWAAGLAVIAPEFGIFKDIISDGENGLLVPEGDAEQLGFAITKLMKNKHLRETLAANGKQSVKKNDIHDAAPRIAEIYYSLLSK